MKTNTPNINEIPHIPYTKQKKLGIKQAPMVAWTPPTTLLKTTKRSPPSKTVEVTLT